MKVSDIAKQFKTSNDFVLDTLKSLKLKAKGADQELNSVVASVLKAHLAKIDEKPVPKPPVPLVKRVVEASPIEKEVVEVVEEKKVKKTAVKKVKEVKETKPKKVLADDKPKKTVKKKESATSSKTAAKKKIGEDVKKSASDVKAGVKKEVEKVADVKKVATKKKISDQPIITLKPLARRRKKTPDGETGTKKGKRGAAVVEEVKPAQAQVNPDGTPIVRDDLADLEVKVPISVKDFSAKLNQKPGVLLKRLMSFGVFAHINQSLDEAVVRKISEDFGFNLVKVRTQEEQVIEVHKQAEEDPKLLKPRAPVITFMGHVDHGKTSLLDCIRKSKVADGEHGGITQHMGAYSVSLPKGRITFLDTPGHEAFTAMRSRGAHITDLVVVVIAADEGIMPQTQEAIDHARAANVPIVIALNKIDRRNADIDRVKKQLGEIDLLSEDWGGSTTVVPVSAMTGEGIDALLELILLEAEILELKANAQKKASGIVVEAHLSQGKGAVTSLIVQTGTLNDGDFIVVGPYYGKIRAMFDDHEQAIVQAGPSMPVEMLGLSSVPEAGELFYVVDDEKQAREISFRRSEQLKNERLNAMTKITLEDLYSNIQEGVAKELNVIIKADVQGSLEALKDSLQKIPSDKVKLNFIHCGIGDINASDVLLAYASSAVIIAFHIGVDSRAKQELEKTPVDVRQYRIIYDAVDDMRMALEGLLDAKKVKNFLSRIEVREVFKLSKSGIVAGCYVAKGKVKRKVHVDVIRNGEVVFTGILSSLKRFKDDVKEVSEGMECGLTIQGFDKYMAGDVVEAYDVQSIAQKL